MKIGFLFAGQGTQSVGMGKELYDTYSEAKEVFDSVKLDYDVKELCFNGPKETLDDTAYSQSAILTTSMAIANVVKSKGIDPDYVCGLSLGEYSALCYAGAFSVNEAANIVRKRGQIMANALPKGTSKMVAVMNFDKDIIKEICEEVKSEGVCEIANYNSPAQIVITGEVKAVDKACEILKEKGARRLIPLNVSGAFHSSLLENASMELNEVLGKYEINKPSIPVLYNVTGGEYDGDIKEILTKQIKSSVYFMQMVEYMIDKDVEAFVEIGPGKVLKGFVRKINKNIPVYSVEDNKSLEEMIGALK
ncbi:ACP S-malonyltransferase [Anaerofustis stercorihominis]|uniref:Malonyl CoA-acyl carrier protein transacylase n=1 Tax=Anaerofustis stercorihominis TaxID=214853 RepID=A0A3E3DUT1_9FIRM|nr:ACP S-malonyltransferase [Anaerofustis stercorihominis]RGD73012.1 [acyl-carrier-protein] S-malonyltransferase [Anaerofustis stercorihominis]